ncbi:MAG: HD domain-containing protein [Chitinophagaceae bacterium]|jgi:predicted hydrolase (HD superfamily)
MSLQLGRNQFGDPKNTGNVLSKEEAYQLLNEWVLNDRLKLHMVQVGGLMKSWAEENEGLDPEQVWKWQMAGLLHDADWDQWPDQHCKKIIEYLEEKNVCPEVLRAIASHGHVHFGVIPESRMDHMLYAFDELSGLIHAYSLMRPNGYEGMELKGALKRIKEKTFAANVSRDDIQDACQRAGLELNNLVQFIITHQAGYQL